MTGRLVAILRVFTISRVRNRISISSSFTIFIVKNCTTNRFIIFITNHWGFLIFKISRNRRDTELSFNIMGKLMNSIPLLTN